MKILLSITLLFLLSISWTISAYSQTEKQKIELRKIVEQYFQTNAEDQNISKTIEDFENAGFISDTLILKTDSSLFYYRAFSKTFNPFQIPVSKVEIQFRENKIQAKGEKNARDTILVLQILGITDSSLENKNAIINEVKRISNEFIPVFPSNRHEKSNKKAKKAYEYYAFYNFPGPFPYILVSFGSYYQNPKIFCINLQLNYRLKVE